jgi:insertion element IS1 protein InsB
VALVVEPQRAKAVRRKALQLYGDGMNLRRIARHLGLHHRTVSLWIQAQADKLPDPPVPNEVKAAEMDEFFTFIGDKKPNLRHHDRKSVYPLLSGLSSRLAENTSSHPGVVDEAPKAKRYYSDAFDAYDRLWYHWGVYEVSQGKTDTYSVEADNAELRHYLARLARRSRCFSRCPEALKVALKLFMYCLNQRQLHKQRFPNYPAQVYQFI